MGFVPTNNEAVSIAKSSQVDVKKFENGFKYTISGTKNQDGEYTIKKGWWSGFKLVKVENTAVAA